MDTFVHFLFPLIVALAARIHIKHGLRWVLLFALIAALLDIDHYIGVPRGSLHNIFITLLLPFVIIFFAFALESPNKTKWKSLSVASLLFLISHPVLDLFDNLGVRFFYPFSEKFYSFANIKIQTVISTGQTVDILNSMGIGIMLFFGLMILIFYLDEVIELMRKHHENLRKALREAFKKEEKNIEKEI